MINKEMAASADKVKEIPKHDSVKAMQEFMDSGKERKEKYPRKSSSQSLDEKLLDDSDSPDPKEGKGFFE